MSSSQHSSQLDTSGLRSYLESALPDSRLTEAPVAPSYDPVLLLKTNHVLAAFAFSNGDVRRSYDAIYQGFKNYYIEQRQQWDQLDLAFVFCVRPDISQLDEFCSKVETDVYFCRKFVVPLGSPIGASLARLPFLPLTPLDGQSLRPPSAQTFLQRCGVPPILAKYLVVQRERGPQKIVEDCINGDFGPPKELTLAPSEALIQSEQITEPIRIESISIENFRAYRKPHTFTFGSDATVLYGANGFGKTSFFDAFDFAATGEIGRIKSHGDDHFLKTAPHLDSTPESSSVSLSFWCNGGLRNIKRTVSDRKHPVLDGIRTDRKTVLRELTSGDFPAADRVENFVSLFRATHLFNQERPELVKDFQSDCCLPSEIVARMLAFEDYASAIGKAAKVRDVLERAVVEANLQIKSLSDQVVDEKKELNRLGKAAKESLGPEALATEFDRLRNAVKELGVVPTSVKLEAAVVRSWRAALEARLADSRGRSERLSPLVKEVAGMPQIRIEAARLQDQIAGREQALRDVEEQRIAAESQSQAAERSVAESNLLVGEVQQRMAIIEWIHVTKPEYSRLVARERSVKESFDRALNSLSQARTSEETSAGGLRTHIEFAAQIAEQLRTKRAGLEKVDYLIEASAIWQTNVTRLGAIAGLNAAAAKALEVLRAEATLLAPQLAKAADDEATLSRRIVAAEKSQSELNSLISQLMGHLESPTCPLCGHDHGSRDELVKRIQEHVSTEVASEDRTVLNTLKEQSRALTDQSTQNMQKKRLVDGQLTELRAEANNLNATIRQTEDSASALGVVLDSSKPAPIKQIQSLRTELRREIDALEVERKKVAVVIDEAKLALQKLKAVLSAKSVEVNEQKVSLKAVEDQLAEMRSDPRSVRVSLDTKDDEQEELQRLAGERLSQALSRASDAQNESAKAKSALVTLQQISKTSKEQLVALRAQLANLQKLSTELTARLEEADFKTGATEEMLLGRIAEETGLQARILALRDSASNLELAMDTATTSAALTQLRETVRNKEKVVAAATETRNQHQPWVKYFTEVSRLASTQQNHATASFTREYGPRTSVIQRRLRSVYGFDELEIRSHESEIRVRVKRHDEVLRPTDFFSQSQQQTLFMGLFLTACISQTWSAFSPVFLDDPVTHFDDLNTYAFLDLVVGLLEPGPWRRQFVISTCDEKLLQLARQKFRHLGERAKFYRFSAIGENGPTVNEVSSK